MTTGLQSVTNFLVPATGSTNAYQIRENFTATPKFISFNNVELDGQAFRPSGVIADNTQGDDDLVILINEVSYRIIVPAGQSIQMPYPAPVNHTVNITGDGTATVIFVDYPVVPYGGVFAVGGGGGSGGEVTIADGADVALGATTDFPPMDAMALFTQANVIQTLKIIAGASMNSITQNDYRRFNVSNGNGILSDLLAATAPPGTAAILRYAKISNVGGNDGSVASESLPAGESVEIPYTPAGTVATIYLDFDTTTFAIDALVEYRQV